MFEKNPFPYRLDEPSEARDLPKALREISGMVWLKDEVLATIQDEKGKVYVYDFDAGEVIHKLGFGKGGDYEGLTARNETLWVVRSDGALFEINAQGGVSTHETHLGKGVDVEGLAWNPQADLLLLACKEGPREDAAKNRRDCFAFDPKTGALLSGAYLSIDLEAVAEFSGPGGAVSSQKPFLPSGAAYHPISGDLYLLSSVGKMIAVYSASGELLHVEGIDFKHFPQPEGLCFSPNGSLYISSEGDGGKGSILRFDID